MVRCSEEKLGLRPAVGAMRDFSLLIDDLELIDFPMQGGSFTWSGGRVFSRIDRFLISGDWEEHFSRVVQLRLERPVSDHWPVLLDSGWIRSGPVPFRFENMWAQSVSFVDIVRSWWEGYDVLGDPSYRLAQKLKLLRPTCEGGIRRCLAS